MKSATVTYCGVPLSCEYEYEPGQSATYIDPGYGPSAALCSCKVGGVEILEMLTNKQQEEVETLILEAQGEQDYIDACEAAALRRSERAVEGFLA